MVTTSALLKSVLLDRLDHARLIVEPSLWMLEVASAYAPQRIGAARS